VAHPRDPRGTFCEFCGELLGLPGDLTRSVCDCPGNGGPRGVRGVQGEEALPVRRLPPVTWDIEGRVHLPVEVLAAMTPDPDERPLWIWDLEER